MGPVMNLCGRGYYYQCEGGCTIGRLIDGNGNENGSELRMFFFAPTTDVLEGEQLAKERTLPSIYPHPHDNLVARKHLI